MTKTRGKTTTFPYPLADEGKPSLQPSSPFTPSRLTLARMRRGLRKNELADKVGIERRTLTGYESGEYRPSPEQMDIIAKELRFPSSFFSRLDLDEVTDDSASFRALSSMTASQRDMAFAAGTIAIEVNSVIENHVQLPPCNLPDLRWEDPVAAAEALREHWKMGVRPIKNVIHLLEFHGVRVFSLADECDKIDAFSLWRNGTPFIFANRSKSGERGRFDAAHELGHLILHRRGAPRGQEAETAADQFASAFLMPKESVFPHAPRVPRGTPALVRLLELKSIWKVSAAALARRLKDLRILTDWQYHSVCVDISRLGYRSAPEPNGIDQEVSQAIPKALAILRDKGMSLSQLSEVVGLFPPDLSGLTFGYVLVPMIGGSSAREAQSKKTRPELRLV
jgi:Zn-dependent peptidase ImmA (M78 family)/DNA-binding XRE family transcriptional regulator